jgi:calcineurin-like phosphoesterase family protein
MIYYISDTHFGHDNIIRHCSRPFKNADEMDAALISNWNERVSHDDTVYVLGDFLFRAVNRTLPEYVNELKGEKHLILGNHDRYWSRTYPPREYFETVNDILEIKDEGRRVVLCHFPIISWNDREHGSFHIHGHIHNSTNADFWPLLRDNPHILNAGVEINNYAPVTFDELVKNNAEFKESHE